MNSTHIFLCRRKAKLFLFLEYHLIFQSRKIDKDQIISCPTNISSHKLIAPHLAHIHCNLNKIETLKSQHGPRLRTCHFGHVDSLCFKFSFRGNFGQKIGILSNTK